MTRRVAALTALAVAAFAASCGSGGDEPPPGSLAALQDDADAGATLELGTADLAPGRNRVSFLVLDAELRSIERPTARVWIARGLEDAPYAKATARLEPVDVPGKQAAELSIYVTSLDTPAPGTYWLLVEPDGADGLQALGKLTVRPKAVAPSVGDRAIPVDNPTVGLGVDPKTITTERPPDTDLLRVSVAEALRTERPFVVTFASPLFCRTRTCGPVVDVVQSVAKRWQGRGVDFVHVEVWEDNYVPNGHNEWVRAWRLPSDPFTYVVDLRGVIRTKFEGAFSLAELDAAVAQVAKR